VQLGSQTVALGPSRGIPARDAPLRAQPESCRLLHHSELSIKQIAERTGFCDRGHFSRVFRGERGLGPAEFRKGGVGVTGRRDAGG